MARRVGAKAHLHILGDPRPALILAVFANSFLIETSTAFLVHVAPVGETLTPRSILLDPGDFVSLRPFVLPEARVATGRSEIALPDAGLRILTSGADVVSPGVHGDICAGDQEILSRLTAVMRGAAGENGPSPLKGFFISRLESLNSGEPMRPPQTETEADPLARILRAQVDEFLDALRQSDWGAVRERVAGIVGLGPGLTPSGDDFLAGFLGAAAVMSRRNAGAEEIFRTLGIVVSDARQKTTKVSAAMLEDAAEGQLSEPAASFFCALFSKEGKQIFSEAGKILALGASSGEDVLNGMAAGVLFFSEIAGEES
ncbi:MAG TPA: DUF2877 domain-containing protein [Thermodesulfobacteriota bacterium]|nr:DUF2877 domain-containing protein [Thermodesulfobacteriota bacterium]